MDLVQVLRGASLGLLVFSAERGLGDSTQMTTLGVSAGVSHGLALRSDGTAWSWGTAKTGQMGNGLTNSTFPVRISSLTNVVGLAAGWNHSLAVLGDGTVWAWGTNNGGQLGNGTTVTSAAPVQVTRISNAVAVCGGHSHSLALLANGQVMAWGRNNSNQLGRGSTVPSATNQPTLVSNLTAIAKISAGANHSAALDSNGVLWCWGSGSYGQIGNGNTDSVGLAVAVLSNVVDVVAGSAHTLALKSDGTVWSWGDNSDGELGIGGTTNQNLPTRISSLSGVQAIGAGYCASAATLSKGQTYIWGWNGGTFTVPHETAAAPAFRQLAVGCNDSAFYLGLTSDGAVWGWGVNELGQLGNNTIQSPALTDILFGPTLSFAAVPAARRGEFLRGNICCLTDQNDLNFCSMVVPIDLQEGIGLNRIGNDAYCYSTRLPWFLCVSNPVGYQSESISTGTSLKVYAVNNPVAAFGVQGGGPGLNVNQPYRFGVYAGGFDESVNAATNVVKISVYDPASFNGQSTNVAPFNTFTIPLPRRRVSSESNAWYSFMTNGASVTVTSNNLTTTVEFLDTGDASDKPLGLSWLSGPTIGNFILGAYKLTHSASATNYFYRVEVLGKVQVATNLLAPMTTNALGEWVPTPLYTLDFSQRSSLQSIYVSRLFFEGTPKPPSYADVDSSGPGGVALTITNVPLDTVYTNVDNSPELRRHPLLDQFVLDMNKDPLVLASYVINEIDLTDPYASGHKTPTVSPQVTCGGVERSALGTFLEGQGSPVEQCALLVYLLRQAGYRAAYVFPTNNNLFMLDTHLSKLWRVQVQGVANVDGLPFLTNCLLSTSYPWVVANIGTNTVHIFPWLKDTEIVEGVNLYDYLPSSYDTALKWVERYVRGDTDIMSLDSQNVVSRLFPAFLRQHLSSQDPTFSLDALGVRAFNRRHQFPSWSYLPRPDVLTNTATLAIVDVLTNTGGFSFLTNMFNTLRVQVYSGQDASGTALLDTGSRYSCDFNDRKFLIFTNQGRLCLWLAPYSTNITTVQSFSASLPSSTALSSNSVAAGNYTSLTVQAIHHRQVGSFSSPYRGLLMGEATGSTNLMHCSGGDVAGIAVDIGRVSPLMLQQHAETYWGLQRQRAANSSFAPKVWEFKGTAAYLLGMGYFEKHNAFDALDRQWHKIQGLFKFSSGLGIIGACPTATNMQVKVDMVNTPELLLGNGSLRADSGVPDITALQNYLVLNSVAGSSQEHEIIQSMFPDQCAVSTVRLLQLAQARATNGNSQILELVNSNVVGAGSLTYQGYTGPLKSLDSNIWYSVTNVFKQPGGDYARVLITPGRITNAPRSYIGMGALILSYDLQASLISANSAALHGAWGSELPGFTHAASSYFLSYELNSDSSGLTFQPINAGGKTVITTPSAFDLASWSSSADNIAWTWQQILEADQILALNGQSGASTGSGMQLGENTGSVGPTDGGFRSLGQTLADPVNVASGAFYVDATDLSLPGPFPLELRRNYSSENLQCNGFGYGWKMNFNPYLVLATNAPLIYAAELDGTVVAYRLTNNAWKVLPQDNPSLNNNSIYGIGSSANLFNSALSVNSNGTSYTISAPDGSTRTYEKMTNAVRSGTNNLPRIRPYLTRWQDHAGNYASFFYGINAAANDYGQLNRINMANGNTLVFKYDFHKRVVQAIAGDGRLVNYVYDDFGDLVTVTLPDASQCKYQYLHYTFSTNNSTCTDSRHLIAQEVKPNGRVLANWYDAQRRVTNQASTVGANLLLVTNAWFYYANSVTNGLATGFTRVEDVFGNPTFYYYTNNLIGRTVDPFGHETCQVWFSDAPTNLPGWYPRSLWYTSDKRKCTNQFYYDAFGNVTQMVVRGNITGEGLSNQTATSACTYTSNNLPWLVSDPVGNATQFTYDTSDPFRVVKSVRLCVATPVCTNFTFYTNVAKESDLGTTNYAFGLPWRSVKGGATNDCVFNANGFLTQSVQYPACADFPTDSDPPVIHSFSYNLRGQLYQDQIVGGGTTQMDYDPMGRMISRRVFDQNGNNLAHEYFYFNRNGELEWYDGPRSSPEDYMYYVYDGAGRVIQQVNFLSQAKIDGSGVEAPAGDAVFATTFQSFDGFGNRTSVTDPRGVTITNLFDALGRLTQRRVLETNGSVLRTESFAYDTGGAVEFATNALGGVTTNSYTQAGHLNRRAGPDGATNGWTYYYDGRQKREYAANGSYWHTVYDDANLVTTRIFYSSGGTPLATNVTVRDRRGNSIIRIDEAMNSFTNVFDGLSRVKYAAGPVVGNLADTNNPPIPGGGGGGSGSIHHAVTNYYDGAGLVVTNLNALGERSISYFDVLGRETGREIRDARNCAVRTNSTFYSADHQSVTKTEGSGAAAITSTFYTDNRGQPVLTISYPSADLREFVLRRYDAAGNLLSSSQNSVSGGKVTVWTLGAVSTDGLNRVTSKMDRDGAATTYAYDPAGNVTTEVVPGGLTHRAAYNAGLQKIYDCFLGSDGSLARSNSYSYSAATGLLQSSTDSRGVSCAYYFDAFLRPGTNVYTGSASEHNLTTVFGYDARGLLTSLSEGFAQSTTGPSTLVARSYDAYSQLSAETISAGDTGYSATVSRDSAGRRTGLGIGGTSFGYSWQADGLLTAVRVSGGGSSYTYDNAGQLLTRTLSPKVVSILQRDGVGRPLAVGTTLFGSNVLGETLSYTADGLLASHSLSGSGLADSRSYTYAPLSRRLSQEIVGLGGGGSWTNSYTYDSGVQGQAGVLTSVAKLPGTADAVWSGGVDAFSRVAVHTNAMVIRGAYGQVNGQARVSALLNGNPMPVTTIGTNAMQWRAQVEAQPGSHELIVSAVHPSGSYTAWATNTFTITNNAVDRVLEAYSGDGAITNRVWISDGQTNATQSLTFDARGRLHSVTCRDSNQSGYTWTAVYDALGRRLETSTVLVTNGVSVSSLPKVINQFFDPEVKFLELGETDNGTTTWKLYGPDLNGIYGGMHGVGGLEATNCGPQQPSPVLSDIRGNGLAVFSSVQQTLTWYPSRPTGYGAVPGHRPLPLGQGAEIAEASAWRGKWADITGFYWLGARYYDPSAARWISFDPTWNEVDPNGFSFCGGDPVKYFDPDGRCVGKAVDFLGQTFLGVNDIVNPTQPPGMVMPDSMEGYYGRKTGQAIGGGISVGEIVVGVPMILGGVTVDYLDIGVELGSGGSLTILTLPVFAGATTVAAEGAVLTANGGFGLYKFMTSEVEQPSSSGNVQGTSKGGSGAGEPSGGVAKADPDGGSGLFRGGNRLEARLGVDVKQASDGLIHPLGKNGKPQGLSLNVDPKSPSVQKYGGAFPVESLPKGLQILPSGGPGHFVIAPAEPMSFEQFQQLLRQVQLGTSNVIP